MLSDDCSFDDLALEDVIGEGTHAVVWSATTPSGQVVAAKCVPDDDEVGVARLRREARLQARAAGHGVLPVLGVVPTRGHLALVTPRATCSLADHLLDRGPLDPGGARRLALDLLTALATLRRTGVVHGDVKPDNVLRVGSHWVLGDFGIARPVDATDPSEDARAGSPAYLDPTHLDAAPHGRKGDRDLWAVAVTVVEAATGELPFDRPTSTGVLRASAGGLDAPVTVPGDPALGALLGAALTPDPALRPSPATWRAELAEALGTTRGSDPRATQDFARPPAAPPTRTPDDGKAEPARARVLAALGAAAVIAATGLAATAVGGAPPASDAPGQDHPDGAQHDLQVQHR